MLLFLFSIVFATAAGVTAFLLLSSGNMKTFKERFLPQGETKQLPIVTPDGNLVDSKEELEAHLEVLESRLMEKVGELETSKTKVDDAKESIDKLHSTQAQVKKYYILLKEEIKKSEKDCKSLQNQIDDYRSRRAELEKEMKKNEAYYKSVLDVVKSGDHVDTSQVSSKSTLNAEGSSSTSFYDSAQTANTEEFSKDLSKTKSTQESSEKTQPKSASPGSTEATFKDSMSKSKKPKRVLHSTPVSRVTSRNTLLDQKSLSQTMLRSPSNSSLSSQREISRTPSRNEVPSPENSKYSMTPTKPLACPTPKVPKSLKTRNSTKMEICCCGSSKCTGTCNLARSIKLGFLKPKDILNVGVAEHVDVLTGKVICDKSCPPKCKPLETQVRKPFTPKIVNRFS